MVVSPNLIFFRWVHCYFDRCVLLRGCQKVETPALVKELPTGRLGSFSLRSLISRGAPKKHVSWYCTQQLGRLLITRNSCNMFFLFSSVLYFHIGLSSLETVLHTGWNVTIVSRSHLGLYFHMSCTFHMFLCVCLAPSCTFQVAPQRPPHTYVGPTPPQLHGAHPRRVLGPNLSWLHQQMCPWDSFGVPKKPASKNLGPFRYQQKMEAADPIIQHHPTRILALSFLSHPVRIMIQTSVSLRARNAEVRARQTGVAQGACDWVVVGMISPGGRKMVPWKHGFA